MCNFFSAIVWNNKGKIEVLWDSRLTSHEELIKKHGLKADKLESRDFVRVELTPEGEGEHSGILTRNRKDWKFKVDEEGTLPNWYRANERKAEAETWKSVERMLKPINPNLDAILKFVRHIRKTKYLEMHGKLNAKWKVFYGKDLTAAWSAARSAAESAARSAAGSAAWSAAGSAAESAARSASLQAELLLVADLDFAEKAKHMATAKAEMEVWERGFGFAAEVGGTLYVYAVGKKGDYEVEA